jgi:hypothetical protein
MKARNCCKTMEMELTAWKAIVYDISRKIEKATSSQRANLTSFLGDLHILIEEMDARIEEIRDSCSPETGLEDIRTEREQYDQAIVNVRMKANEAMQVLGAGSFGG